MAGFDFSGRDLILILGGRSEVELGGTADVIAERAAEGQLFALEER